jgi:hypothetical protein
MTLAPDYLDNLRATLARLEHQGLPADTVQRAQECTEKMLALVQQYGPAGVVALGLTAGTLDNYLYA